MEITPPNKLIFNVPPLTVHFSCVIGEEFGRNGIGIDTCVGNFLLELSYMVEGEFAEFNVFANRTCTLTCDSAEYEGINQGTDQRIQKQLRRSQNGLLVSNCEITLGKQHDQIPVLPYFFQVQVEPAVLGRDMRVIRMGRMLVIQN